MIIVNIIGIILFCLVALLFVLRTKIEFLPHTAFLGQKTAENKNKNVALIIYAIFMLALALLTILKIANVVLPDYLNLNTSTLVVLLALEFVIALTTYPKEDKPAIKYFLMIKGIEVIAIICACL